MMFMVDGAALSLITNTIFHRSVYYTITFYGPLSGSTWVSWYWKKHSSTHTITPLL